MHDIEWEELHRDYAQACGSEDQIKERPGQASPVLKYPVPKAGARRTLRHFCDLYICCVKRLGYFYSYDAHIFNCVLHTYITHNYLMFIYIPINY